MSGRVSVGFGEIDRIRRNPGNFGVIDGVVDAKEVSPPFGSRHNGDHGLADFFPDNAFQDHLANR